MQTKNTVITKLRGPIYFALVTVALAGCAGTPDGGQSVEVTSAAAEIAAQRAELESQRAELARKEQELTRRLSTLDAQMSSAPAGGAASAGLMPTDAKPGECYAQVIVPAKFETVVKEVVRQEASERIETIPAVFRQVTKRVMVKPESSYLEIVPAQYETVSEQVLIKPETKRLEAVPAQFEMVDERVMVKPPSTKIEVIPAVYEEIEVREIETPAHTAWKPVTDLDENGSGAFSSAAPTIERFGDYKVLETRVEDTGVMCLVEIPAKYKVTRKRVVKSPASMREIEIPAEYKTVSKRVQTAPATTREVVIPAEYRTVEVVREVRPAGTREVKIPAEYIEVSEREMVSKATTRVERIPEEKATETTQIKVNDAKIEWRPVLCKVNMTRENVSALQTALTATGFCRCGPRRNACPVDGLPGRCTFNAAKRFAQDRGLAYGEFYITMDVVRALGLNFSLPGSGEATTN